jgi:hypothetical protein
VAQICGDRRFNLMTAERVVGQQTSEVTHVLIMAFFAIQCHSMPFNAIYGKL